MPTAPAPYEYCQGRNPLQYRLQYGVDCIPDLSSPYMPPAVTTGGAGSVPAPTNVSPPLGPAVPGGNGCKGCAKATPAAVAAAAGLPAAAGAPAAAKPCDCMTLDKLPWWVWVLGLLVLAGVVHE